MADKDEMKREPLTEKDVSRINQLIGDMRYGTVTLVFQNGVLTQADKLEKIRFNDKN